MSFSFFKSAEKDWSEHFTKGGTGVVWNAEPKLLASVRLFDDEIIFLVGTNIHTTRANANISDLMEFHVSRTAI